MICAENLNAYRVSRGLSPVPVPKVRQVKPISLAAASLVREVVVKPLPTSFELISKRALALKGKPLTTEAIRSFLEQFVRMPGNRLPGIRLTAYRDEDGKGFQITIDAQYLDPNRNDTTIDYSICAVKDGKRLPDEHVNCVPDSFLPDDGFKNLTSEIDSSPGFPLYIAITVAKPTGSKT